jgi:hypothetical protein
VARGSTSSPWQSVILSLSKDDAVRGSWAVTG